MKLFIDKTNEELSHRNIRKSKRHIKAKLKNKVTGKKSIETRRFYDRQIRTTMHIEGGLYEIFNELFHVLPGLFVIIDVVLGETVFHKLHMESWQLILMLIGAEVFVLYLYRVILEFRGREGVLRFIYETYDDNDGLADDIDNYIFKRHGNGLTGRYFIALYSMAQDTTDKDLGKKVIDDPTTKSLNGNESINEKSMNVISISSNGEILTLKKFYLNYKMISLNAEENDYIFSKSAFISIEDKEINGIVETNKKNDMITTGIISMDLDNSVTSYSGATKVIPGNISGIVKYGEPVLANMNVSKGFNKIITARYIRKAKKNKNINDQLEEKK